MGARPRLAPRQRMHLLGDRPTQQLVPGRVELDLVDPMAETVVGAQLRRMTVGLLTKPDGRRLPEPRPEPAEALLAPGATLALDSLEERAVVLEPVDPSSGGGWFSTSCVGERASSARPSRPVWRAADPTVVIRQRGVEILEVVLNFRSCPRALMQFAHHLHRLGMPFDGATSYSAATFVSAH